MGERDLYLARSCYRPILQRSNRTLHGYGQRNRVGADMRMVGIISTYPSKVQVNRHLVLLRSQEYTQ